MSSDCVRPWRPVKPATQWAAAGERLTHSDSTALRSDSSGEYWPTWPSWELVGVVGWLVWWVGWCWTVAGEQLCAAAGRMIWIPDRRRAEQTEHRLRQDWRAAGRVGSDLVIVIIHREAPSSQQISERWQTF